MILYKIIPVVQAALSFSLVLLITTTHKRKLTKNTASYLFALYLLSMTAWGSFAFLRNASSNTEQAYNWEKFVFTACVLTQVLIYHFSIIYSGIKVSKWFLIFVYLVLIFIITICFINPKLLFANVTYINGSYSPNISLKLLIPVLILISLTIYNFWNSTRKTQIPIEKNRNLYIFCGYVLCIIISLFEIKPSLNVNSMAGNIIFCSITTFAIVKYQLLDINIVLRRVISYLLMSLIITIPYVFLLYLVTTVWRISISKPILIILLIFIAIVLHPLWRIIQKLVNRFYYRRKYDNLLELRKFAAITHDISDIKKLTDTTIKLLDQTFKTSGICVLTPSETSNYNVIGSSNDKLTNIYIPEDNDVIDVLMKTDKVLNVTSLNSLNDLPANDRLKQFNDLNIELIVPLKSMKNNLAGIILIGKKLSGQHYVQAEENLMFHISRHIAPDFENANLYNMELVMRHELEQQAKIKSEFLHNVAHELKTPLTAIISSSESIIDFSSAKLDKKERKLLKNISTNAWSLDKRVSELLDFARYETTATLNLQSINLKSLLLKIVSKTKYIFKKKEQTLHVNIPERIPSVMGDIDKLQQVMFNLVLNANKLSPEKSNVYLRVYEDGIKIVIEIEDSASIIEDTEKIFDLYKVNEEIETTSSLELTLPGARSLIELHKGEIKIVKNNLNSGNIVIVSLPIEIKNEELPDENSNY